MSTLDEDTRHADRNEAAKQRAADQMRPVVRKLLADTLEIDEDEIPAARDAIKELMRARTRREERKNQTVAEAIKWAVGAVLGAAATYFMTHQGGGK